MIIGEGQIIKLLKTILDKYEASEMTFKECEDLIKIYLDALRQLQELREK